MSAPTHPLNVLLARWGAHPEASGPQRDHLLGAYLSSCAAGTPDDTLIDHLLAQGVVPTSWVERMLLGSPHAIGRAIAMLAPSRPERRAPDLSEPDRVTALIRDHLARASDSELVAVTLTLQLAPVTAPAIEHHGFAIELRDHLARRSRDFWESLFLSAEPWTLPLLPTPPADIAAHLLETGPPHLQSDPDLLASASASTAFGQRPLARRLEAATILSAAGRFEYRDQLSAELRTRVLGNPNADLLEEVAPWAAAQGKRSLEAHQNPVGHPVLALLLALAPHCPGVEDSVAEELNLRYRASLLEAFEPIGTGLLERNAQPRASVRLTAAVYAQDPSWLPELITHRYLDSCLIELLEECRMHRGAGHPSILALIEAVARTPSSSRALGMVLAELREAPELLDHALKSLSGLCRAGLVQGLLLDEPAYLLERHAPRVVRALSVDDMALVPVRALLVVPDLQSEPAPAAFLAAHLGDDPHALETFIVLARDFSGTLGELVAAARAL